MANRKGYKPPADVGSDRREIVDKDHRRIGHMWPEDFESILKAIYGFGWVATFARYAGLSRDTIDLYRKGSLPIPRHIAQLVTLLRWVDNRRKKRSAFPSVDPFWLPPLE